MITDKDMERAETILRTMADLDLVSRIEMLVSVFARISAESADQARKEADEKLAIAVKAMENIIAGNDLACERGESMASWMDSDFRRQAKDALKEIQG